MKKLVSGVACLAILAGVSLVDSKAGLAYDGSSKQTLKQERSYDVNFFVNYEPYHYEWKEEANGKHVKEEGWIHGVEVGAKVNYYGFFLEPKFTLYGGEVDYDGVTWGGDEVSTDDDYNPGPCQNNLGLVLFSGDKVSTYDDYNGWALDLNVGKEFYLTKNFKLAPYVNVGYEYWKRQAENNFEGSTLVLGYSEKWSKWQVGIGVKPEYDLGSYYVFGDVYLKYQFNVKNEVDLFDVTVKPGESWSCGVEAGVGARDFVKKGVNLEASAFYVYDDFRKSSAKYSPVVGGYVYQPESERELWGFKVGLRF